MIQAVHREIQAWVRMGVRMWARGLVMLVVASIGLSGGLSACAGEGGRVRLQVPTLGPLAGPPGSPRLGVRLLYDLREPEVLKAREGWFLEYLPDEALEQPPVLAVTQALVERLRASGRFQEVLSLEPDEGLSEPFNPPRDPVPVELVLEGDLLAFYAERDTTSHPFVSLLTLPLGFPLAALSGLKLLPTPISPILPVNYRANLTFRVRLRDSRTGSVVWERMVEGIGEHKETAGADFFKSKEAQMGEAAFLALRTGIEKLARQLPPSDWFMARWPKRHTLAPIPPGARPR